MNDNEFNIKAFNNGYILGKHKPGLAQQLANGNLSKDKSVEIKSMLAGIEKAQQEKAKTVSKNYDLSSVRSPKMSKQKDKDLGLDKY